MTRFLWSLVLALPLLFLLLPASGCSSGSGSGDGPKLQTPENPNIKPSDPSLPGGGKKKPPSKTTGSV